MSEQRHSSYERRMDIWMGSVIGGFGRLMVAFVVNSAWSVQRSIFRNLINVGEYKCYLLEHRGWFVYLLLSLFVDRIEVERSIMRKF